MQSARLSHRAARAAVFACCLFSLSGGLARAESGAALDRFEAMTTNMTPAGLTLEVHVLEWSDQARRAEVAAVLESDSGIRERLAEMPTLGYLWVDGSAVGYALKYTHREVGEEGSERVTLVTDRPLGSYSFDPWQVGGEALAEEADYSVIELDLSDGTGYLSKSAVVLDAQNTLVGPGRGDTMEPVLSEVRPAGQSYWARQGERNARE